MFNEVRLQEFGFKNAEAFPRLIDNQEITLTLPTAGALVDPVAVQITAGLLVPVQLPSGMAQGMVIDIDGRVVSISQQHNDPENDLHVQFVEEVPYDARVEVANVMQRALMINPELNDVWQVIRRHWQVRFPANTDELERQAIGRYDDVHAAWQELCVAFMKLIQQMENRATLDRVHVEPQVVVQTQDDFELGWLGKEVLVDRLSLQELDVYSMSTYCQQRLGPKLREHLADPLYDPKSTFALYYEARLFPTVKLVVLPRL